MFIPNIKAKLLRFQTNILDGLPIRMINNNYVPFQFSHQVIWPGKTRWQDLGIHPNPRNHSNLDVHQSTRWHLGGHWNQKSHRKRSKQLSLAIQRNLSNHSNLSNLSKRCIKVQWNLCSRTDSVAQALDTEGQFQAKGLRADRRQPKTLLK